MKKGDYQYGLFPLRIFLFPGEQTTLHIFEPRYLQLVTECLSSGEYFGIPYQGKTTLSELGSLVKVVHGASHLITFGSSTGLSKLFLSSFSCSVKTLG